MSTEETANKVRIEVWVDPEQRERWQRAASKDNRKFAQWARLVLDKAAEEAEDNGKEPQDG